MLKINLKIKKIIAIRFELNYITLKYNLSLFKLKKDRKVS